MIPLKALGIVFTIVGVVGFVVALLRPQIQLLGVGVGVISFFLAASSFSTAAHLARALVPWVNSRVYVEVWGKPLGDSGEEILEINSIAAFGAGLLIHLSAMPSVPRSLLKIAQPRSARFEEGRFEIPEARYVSWAGRKLPPVTETRMPALVLTQVEVPSRGSAG